MVSMEEHQAVSEGSLERSLGTPAQPRWRPRDLHTTHLPRDPSVLTVES